MARYASLALRSASAISKRRRGHVPGGFVNGKVPTSALNKVFPVFGTPSKYTR
jgi:hypothetical protein